MVVKQTDSGSIALMPTLLGKAAFASSIPAEFALQIFKDLADARDNLVLESDLHLLYLITPHFKNLREPNWEIFMKRFDKFNSAEQNVAAFYGLDAEYLFRQSVIKPRLPDFLMEPVNSSAASKQPSTCASTTKSTITGDVDPDTSSLMDLVVKTQSLSGSSLELVKYCKFYMAMIMNEILKETPIKDICLMFNLKRGDIQAMQQHAINFSGMLSAFCERLFWVDYSCLFQRINEKINCSVKEELLELMQIPSIKPERARSLY